MPFGVNDNQFCTPCVVAISKLISTGLRPTPRSAPVSDSTTIQRLFENNLRGEALECTAPMRSLAARDKCARR